MTLEEWLEITRSELELFGEFWGGQSRTSPEHFSPEMSPDEWDEKFISYTAYRRPPE